MLFVRIQVFSKLEALNDCMCAYQVIRYSIAMIDQSSESITIVVAAKVHAIKKALHCILHSPIGGSRHTYTHTYY